MIFWLANDFLGNTSIIEYKEKVEDDPQRRRPDITVAKENLNWEPKVKLREGLAKSIDYFRGELKKMQENK